MSHKGWIQKDFGDAPQTFNKAELQPFSIRETTGSQEAAIRSLATQAGFKDLRGFWSWVRSAGLDYYDLIKVASPE